MTTLNLRFRDDEDLHASLVTLARAGARSLNTQILWMLRGLVNRRDGRGVCVFMTGLPGAGKSTIARRVAERLGDRVIVLDGDDMRRLLPLGYGRLDRALNVRVTAFIASKIVEQGGTVVCSMIAPYADARAEARGIVREHGHFLLVHVATPVAECERRDPKGLYARARAGKLDGLTGASAPYEEPADADLRLDTTGRSVDDSADEVLALLR